MVAVAEDVDAAIEIVPRWTDLIGDSFRMAPEAAPVRRVVMA
tara:strand:- start:171 stop:296 length:126 start_codon:yes stop_codon:yes gene_type:complete